VRKDSGALERPRIGEDCLRWVMEVGGVRRDDYGEDAAVVEDVVGDCARLGRSWVQSGQH
jgi:hypothetical protein